MNPAIERAVQLQLQQDPPFTEDDLAAVEVLAVLRPTDISELRQFTSLRVLRLNGYGDEDLQPLAGLPIKSLDIEVSAVSGLAVVAELPALSMLAVPNNFITEIDVLAAGDHRLRELDLTGNPLSDRAYYEVIPELRDRVPELQFSGEREWKLTRKLHASGLPFDYYRNARGYWLCRPGLNHTAKPNADHLEIEPDELEAILDRDPAEIPGLFPVRDDS